MNEDIALLKKVSPVIAGTKYLIPEPKLCPSCRMQRRFSFRNERNIYHRPCSETKKDIISIYSPDKNLNVINSEYWWSDNWDPCDYGQEIDFSRSIFDQIKELLHRVPLLSNMVFNCTNSEFNSFCVDSKNIYMCTRIGDSEDINYSFLTAFCKDCTDCYGIFHCEFCYECIDCSKCYNSSFCQLCKSSTDCLFCYDCIGCKNCFGCIGLRNVDYYFFNEKCTKEEYKEKTEAYRNGSMRNIMKWKDEMEKFMLKHPKRAVVHFNTENSSGDYINNTKDVKNCFDIEDLESSAYSCGVEYSKDIYDSDFIYYGENCYENISNSKSTNIAFSFVAIGGVHDLIYSMLCFNNTHDCFGCISLKQKSYCILNKQYTKEEYEELVPKIIEKMKEDGEWGEFFPSTMSSFAYNETVAQEYFPLSKEEVKAKGWMWKEKTDEIPNVNKIIPANNLPDSIKEIPDDILNWAIVCPETKRPFKIVSQELGFYKTHGIPIPHFHPDERHKRRMTLRNPRKLWTRSCNKCDKEIQTSYAPERPETVYCETCYLKEVY